jgi:hypothetical protein
MNISDAAGVENYLSRPSELSHCGNFHIEEKIRGI